MKRWLYLTHRWTGIVLCLVMAAWFLSGMVMMYVGYPKLTDGERWQSLTPLSPVDCCVPLASAMRAAGLDPEAGRAGSAIRLTSVAGRPRYVFSEGTRSVVAVDAIRGERIALIDAEHALASARHFAADAPARWLGQVGEDAWTHSRALDAHRPLHRIAVDDDSSRWLYVSSRTGEVVRDASAVERNWGWVGAWLHWLYMFRGGPLDRWWTEIVIGLSLASTLLAVTGVVAGTLRWRFGKRYRNGRHTPYAGFNARWHHILGMVGGVLAVTWVVSGLLSVNPGRIFDAAGPRPDRAAYAGGPLRADDAIEASDVLRRLGERGAVAKELEWRRIDGEPYVLAHGGPQAVVFDQSGERPDGVPQARWQAAAKRLLPDARIAEMTLLTRYDVYYYARASHTMTGHRERPLPVWRVTFDDANETTVTIDPRTGSIVQIQDKLRRLDRWLFAFLHSFDLPQLLAARPLWDIGMLAFSLAGLGLSMTGVVLGARRLARKRAEIRRTLPARQ